VRTDEADVNTLRMHADGHHTCSAVSESIAKFTFPERVTAWKTKAAEQKFRGNARLSLAANTGETRPTVNDGLSAYRLYPLQQDIPGCGIRRREMIRRVLYRRHEIPRRLLHRVLPLGVAFARVFAARTCECVHTIVVTIYTYTIV